MNEIAKLRSEYKPVVTLTGRAMSFPRLRLLVDNTGSRFADRFADYCAAKRRWDFSRYSGRPDNDLRLAAFNALKAWSPDTAEPYGAGETWGFA